MLHILVIEDEIGFANLIQKVISESQNMGFLPYTEVAMTKTLSDGIKMMKVINPDIVVLDLSLPDSHGMDTIKRIPELSRQGSVIVLTGASDASIAGKCLESGAVDFVSKDESSNQFEILHHAIVCANEVRSRNKRLMLKLALNQLDEVGKTCRELHHGH